MFDFLKDLYLQASGLDMDQIEKERKAKMEAEKNETILMRTKSKKNLAVVGVIFVMIHVLGIIIAAASHDTASMIKSSIMIGLAVLAILCSLIKSKITEIICIVLCCLVVLLTVVMANF